MVSTAKEPLVEVLAVVPHAPLGDPVLREVRVGILRACGIP